MTGQLTYDALLGDLRFVDGCTYEADLEIHGCRVRLSMIVDVHEEETVMAAARALLPRLPAITAEARGYAAAKLLDIKNPNWLAEDEAPLTLVELANRFVLEEVALYDGSGAVEIAFGDGDAFSGHTILVGRTASGAFEDAGIHG